MMALSQWWRNLDEMNNIRYSPDTLLNADLIEALAVAVFNDIIICVFPIMTDIIQYQSSYITYSGHSLRLQESL